MGKKGLGEENSGVHCCASSRPILGTHYSVLPKEWSWVVPEYSSLKCKTLLTAPKGLNEKAMQVEVRVGGAASVHQPPMGKFAGKPLLASEHLQFAQLYSGNLELPPHSPRGLGEAAKESGQLY